MVTIKADLSSLTKDQREALCGFILNYPPVQSIPFLDEEPEVNNETIPTAPTPSEAFGNTLQVTNVPSLLTPPVVTNGQIAAAGPVLVISSAPEVQSSVITDKAGLPWDDRIHSSSKGQTADGLWRKKRGVSEQEIAKVESELRKLMNLPAAAPAPPAPEPVTSIQLPANVQIVPPPPPAAAPTPPAPVNDRQAFVQLVGKASAAISAGKLTSEELQSIVKSIGVESLQLLGNRLDLVPQVSTMIDLQLQGK